MALSTTVELLRRAQAERYGVPAFNVVGLEHAEAIVRGAELERAPVILQLSENAVRYHFGAVEPIGRACVEIAGAATVPVALHLDHATNQALCERAVAAGFSSVMLDTSDLPLAENSRRTAELAIWAHRHDIAVEAALGVVGGKDGAETSGAAMTDPAAARSYIAETGADSLAVAVGTSHYMTEPTARLDLSLLAQLRDAVDVPLVLHGASGVPDADLVAAVGCGAVKINLATYLNNAFTGAVRGFLATDGAVVDPRTYLGAARQAVIEAVRDRLRLLGGGGTA